jgi:hypothetical protein
MPKLTKKKASITSSNFTAIFFPFIPYDQAHPLIWSDSKTAVKFIL